MGKYEGEKKKDRAAGSKECSNFPWEATAVDLDKKGAKSTFMSWMELI